MSSRSPLFGRRIHIAGSIATDASIASVADVEATREFIARLTQELTTRGANFVIPVDAEKLRSADDLPICFDWLVWRTLNHSLPLRPDGARAPAAIAVQHHKNERQIPDDVADMWDALRQSADIQIENVSHWNMNSKRMEAQARWGDVLIALGGGEGVLFLANLYRDMGKPVVPFNFEISREHEGARRLFSIGLSSQDAPRLFGAKSWSAHAWINRINFSPRTQTEMRVAEALNLLEDLQPPKAFGVRLLNPKHEEFDAVEAYFNGVVRPFVEEELGYELIIVDGKHAHDHARVDQEIFEKLHRSSLVVADITGSRPNCFLELGYAFAREIKTLVLAKEGTQHPFDIETFGAHHWNPGYPIQKQLGELSAHWRAVENRPAIIGPSPLVA